MIRNTVITGGDMTSKAAGLDGRDRIQRKVLPTPVTCIAFRHKRGPPETAETVVRRAGQQETQVEQIEIGPANSHQGSPRPARQSPGQQASATASTSSDVESMLITGDELGSIKVWDVTGLLRDKLGLAACVGESTKDKATVLPASDARQSHFIHHRAGPFDGVGPRAAVRFRELIEMAKELRRGDHVTSARPAMDSTKLLGRAGLGGRIQAENRNTGLVGTKSPTGSHGASSATDGSRDPPTRAPGFADCPPDRSLLAQRRRSLATRGAHEPLAEQTRRRVDGALFQPLSSTTSDVCDGQQRAGRPAGPRAEVEAVLNAEVDSIDPVASWKGHRDSITSIQVRPRVCFNITVGCV